MVKNAAPILSGMLALLLSAAPATAEGEPYEPIEPLFTERAFLDHAIELGAQWSDESDGNAVEVAAALEYIVWKRLEVDVEVPVGINIPNHGDTEADLSDIDFAVQALLCCDNGTILDFFSIRASVAAPTGNRSKGIGGDGSWEISVLPGRYFTIVPQLPALLTQLQLSYTQEIRLDDEERETASEFGLSKSREKSFLWNLAFAQPYFDGLLKPVFEILGTTIVDDVSDDDEGTIVELGGGLWLAPHAESRWLRSLSYRIGFKWPATSRKEDHAVGVFVLEWDLN